MRFYYVNAAIDGAPYTATLEEAKRVARNAASNSYNDVVVELVEVATDKEKRPAPAEQCGWHAYRAGRGLHRKSKT